MALQFLWKSFLFNKNHNLEIKINYCIFVVEELVKS